MTFRTKIFATALASAAVAVLVATMLVSWSMRRDLEARVVTELRHEAGLAAEMLAHSTAETQPDVQAEAHAVGRILGARVTFIAADGRVLGDSELDEAAVMALENHGTRPEVVQSRAEGFGASRRYSNTLKTNMMYIAVPVRGTATSIATIRLALPLTDVDRQLASVWHFALIGFATAMVIALGMTWAVSFLLGRRLRVIADVARGYSAGDLTRRVSDYSSDEIGTVARALDTSVQELGSRMTELASDRARMAAILAGMIEGVLVVDAAGHVELANAAVRGMLRLEDDPAGRHYVEVIRNPAIKQQISAALRRDPTASIELAGRDPDSVLIARTASVNTPAATGAVVVLHDITDLRRADRVRRDFVANVSHELRTPLTAIRGYLEALSDATAEETTGFLEIISRHTLRMERLVRDLLRLARLESGQERLEAVPCSLDAVFTRVEADLEPLIESKGLTVERRIAGDASEVRADPQKLQDALRNLLENAANYSPERGRVLLQSIRREGRVLISVSDDGPGIPEEDLGRVFERFYRVDKSRTRDGRDPGGTGLGLSIVKHIVDIHGGQVRAANRLPHGAVFTIELPA
jgi:two-component system phosphate regulon sensor histidine kinase PhoR